MYFIYIWYFIEIKIWNWIRSQIWASDYWGGVSDTVGPLLITWQTASSFIFQVGPALIVKKSSWPITWYVPFALIINYRLAEIN